MQDQSYLIQPVSMSYVQNEAGACAETWLSGGHGVRLYSDSKNPFHTNLNGGARSAPPNTVGIALSLGGVKDRRYSWLQDRPLGHVIWFTRC